jgi:hypothetical protein
VAQLTPVVGWPIDGPLQHPTTKFVMSGPVAEAGAMVIIDKPVPNKMAAVAIEINFLNMM